MTLNEASDNKSERHEFIISRKFDDFLVVFTKEPSGNPNIDKMYYDMEGYDIDHKGRREKSFDGRYSKSFKDEAAWRRAMTRIKKKSINEDAPANAVAQGGVSLPADAVGQRKKKKSGLETKVVVDRRYRKDRSPILIKRFRQHAGM